MARDSDSTAAEASPTKGARESQHSHFEYKSTLGRWDREAGSDFAATTVDVPDRLDTQEVRARAADDGVSSVSRFHRDDVIRFSKWAIVLAVLLGAVAWAAHVAGPVKAAISPAGVEAQVSRALGTPVSVAATDLRLWPSPRLVVSGVVSQSGFRLPEVVLHFNWRDVPYGLRSANWVLGEARVAAIELSGKEAWALLQSVRPASALPGTVSSIRFESVSFTDLSLLPGRYEVVIRRGASSREFGEVALKRLDGGGEADVEVLPARSANGAAAFKLFASKWPAPVGPAVVWREATAQGEFGDDRLKVDSFSVGADFGNLNGSALIARQGSSWQLSGSLRGPDLNLDQLTRRAARLADNDAAAARVPLRGTAKLDLALAGTGPTMDQALGQATAAGSFSVAGASLNGLNLGLAVAHGGAEGAGGTTRFTDLEGELIATNNGLAVRSLSGRAGSLRVSGAFEVDRQLQLRGALRPEVMSPRGVAVAQVRLAGTLRAPEFR